jgi:phage baseplate assembly protein W
MAVRTRKYKDLNFSLVVNPNTQDLTYLQDDEDIKRALKNLVLTSIYERHFDDTYGCVVKTLLFEPLSYFTAISIKSSIESAITAYEPRVSLIDVAVIPDSDEHGYNIKITFQIQNSPQPITVQFFLERVR